MSMSPSFDLARARADTPGVANVLHFNNAGCALPIRDVVDACVAYLRLEAEIGGYEAADRMSAELARPYAALAKLLNSAPEEIALVENATRAWDSVFYALKLEPGDRILTGQAEYSSNFIGFLHRQQRDGIVIDVAPNSESGEVSVEALQGMIGPHTRLIAITHVPSTGGLVNPVASIGAIARQAGIPFLLDATQSVGQIPIDVDVIGCDMLVGTSRKCLRGPRGVGFLYVRRGMLDKLEPVFLDDHAATWIGDFEFRKRADVRKFESPECSYASRIGFGVALDYALEWSIPVLSRRIFALAATLRSELTALPRVRLHDTGREQCGIVTFSVDGCDPAQLRAYLGQRRINVTVATIEATRLDMGPRGLDRMIRASVHYYNSNDEIDRFVQAISTVQPD